jgi:hypothetical protein
MAIIPEVAVAKHRSDFIVCTLRPPLLRTLALIEHRNKMNDPALEVVRNELLCLQAIKAKQAVSNACATVSPGKHGRRSGSSWQRRDDPG